PDPGPPADPPLADPGPLGAVLHPCLFGRGNGAGARTRRSGPFQPLLPVLVPDRLGPPDRLDDLEVGLLDVHLDVLAVATQRLELLLVLDPEAPDEEGRVEPGTIELRDPHPDGHRPDVEPVVPQQAPGRVGRRGRGSQAVAGLDRPGYEIDV